MNGDIMAMHKKLDEMIPGAPSQESRVATFIGLGRGMSNLKMGSFDGYLRWLSKMIFQMIYFSKTMIFQILDYQRIIHHFLIVNPC